MRRFGFDTVNRKEPFPWEQVVRFAEAYGVRHQGYCHLVVVTMLMVMFGGMCRCDDASRRLWWKVRFLENGSGFKITFEKRKNAQFRQGNKVMVASSPLAVVCPLQLLMGSRRFTSGSEDLCIFRGINGRLIAKSSAWSFEDRL